MTSPLETNNVVERLRELASFNREHYATTSEPEFYALGDEAADLIQSLSDRIAYSLDDWQALVRIIGENVKETDGPDRVRWEGVWYDGPLATAYLKTLRAIEEMAKRSVASLTQGGNTNG